MALTPNFDRIVATITAADVQTFFGSTATEDEKQQVRDAATDEIRMRFVGGYLIRVNQITPERLDLKTLKVKNVTSRAARARKPRKPSVTTQVVVAT
jgi:hypothetical protein